MTKRTVGKVAILVLAGASGSLGAGLLVYDAVGDVSWIATAAKTAESAFQLKQSYNQAVQMATALKGTAAKWKSGITDWRFLTSADTYGVNAGWNVSMNNGVNVPANFARITTAANTSMSSIPGSFQQAAKLGIASIERHDGLIQQNAATIGSYNLGQAAYQRNVLTLANSVTSDDPEEQTYAALQQKQASATMLLVQAYGVNNELQKQSLANGQAQMLMQREAAVRDNNRAAYVYANATAALQSSNDPSALSRLVIP